MSSLSVTNRWNVLFGIAASLYTLGNIGYICLVTAVTQPWNNPIDAEVNGEEPEESKEQEVPLKGAIQKGRPSLGGGGGSAQSGQSKDTCVVTVTS